MLKSYVTYLMAKFGCKKGQGMVEYGLILALIAVAVIGTVTLLGGQLKTLFTSVTEGLKPTP